MANRRITKGMAYGAAWAMYDAVYKEQLKIAEDKVNKAIEEFAKGYFPAPVLACVEEYRDYYKVTKDIDLYVYQKKDKDGDFIGSHEVITGESSFIVPVHQKSWSSRCHIEVLEKDIKKVVTANNACKELREKAHNFRTKIHNILIELKTEKKVAENLPEALPYIKFPDDKSNLPAPVFSEIRNLLKGVTVNKQ